VTDLETQLKKTAKRFAAETEHHEMKVLRRDGVYRHLRFMNPGDSAYWFEIHTGPRFLLFRGDGESYVFSNGGTDMFSFFRHGVYKDGSLHPDPGYWTKKLSTAVQAEKWDEDVFRTDLEQHITDMVESEAVSKEDEQRFRDEVEEHLLYEDVHSADLAIKVLMEFEFRHSSTEPFTSSTADTSFDECWEWISRCTEYDWWYLWALHGILYGVREFDRRFGIPGKKVDVSTAGVQVA
jgi:hypothetical protein